MRHHLSLYGSGLSLFSGLCLSVFLALFLRKGLSISPLGGGFINFCRGISRARGTASLMWRRGLGVGGFILSFGSYIEVCIASVLTISDG